MTLDGRIASSTGDSKWISSDYSRLFAHRLRSICDAIIVGKNTFVNDNPSLNVRFGDFNNEVKKYMKSGHAVISGRKNFLLEQLITTEHDSPRSPLRVLLGMPQTVPADCNFIRDADYIIIAGRDEFENAILNSSDLKKQAEQIVFIMDYLRGRGVINALLEGGAGVNGSFLDAGATDQFIYSIAPKILGSGIPPVNGEDKSAISDSLRLHDITSVMLKEDVLICGYREQYNFEMM
jgi:diaminohydroxyphosphoribosylaminopyrimidine deaminase/5-amino-6-(5-phosphoribosylamino)uracil reductase